MKCAMRGPRSRAGLIAYPVGPPRLAPIPTISRPTASGPSPDGVCPLTTTQNTSTKVPMASVTKFQPYERMAGPVHEHVGDRRVDALGEIYSSHPESDGDRRVEVATGLVGDENTRHYPDAPPKVDKKPSAVESLALR